MKQLFFTLVILASFDSQARVFAQFHPHDPTLQTVAGYIYEAESRLDIAMYNIDIGPKNPVVQALSSTEVQEKIRRGQLQVRMIFEGFESKSKKLKKMMFFEELGVDVRHLGSSRKMHHKFAVIDSFGSRPVLISGSANWSMMSRLNFDENILFFEEERGITLAYQNQFDRLWGVAKEVGAAKSYETARGWDGILEPGFHVFFNTDNFHLKNGQLVKKRKPVFRLTRELVKSIDAAEKSIWIATTRIKLRPVYDALLRAAARGVKVQALVTMGEYEYKGQRKKKAVPKCENEFKKSCSSGHNFSVFLDREDFRGSENVEVRLKWFHLKKAAYLNRQMHSKYLIVDGKELLTGSFNWSYSAEYSHIENLIRVNGVTHPSILRDYLENFSMMWERNRGELDPLVQEIHSAIEVQEKMSCGFSPISLEFEEIDHLISQPRKLGSSIRALCR